MLVGVSHGEGRNPIRTSGVVVSALSLKEPHAFRATLLYTLAVVMLILSVVLSASWILLWLVFPQGFY